MKKCTKCGILKPLEDFHKDNRYNRKSHRARCIECGKVDKKEDYAKNGREYKLSTQYGLSESDYQDMLEKQGNQCAICGIDADEYKSKTGRYLAVDHHHVTGGIRGLLCMRDNTNMAFVDGYDSRITRYRSAIPTRYMTFDQLERSNNRNNEYSR
jgi:hypothetical protein